MTVEKSLQMLKKQKNTCLKLIVNQINVTNVKKSLVKGQIVKRLGLGLGTWDLGPGNRIENRESRIETTPSPSADSKMPGATTHHHHHPITFRGDEGL